MRIPITCMACSWGNPDPLAGRFLLQITEDGAYSLNCPNGHKSVTCLQEQKFELLFELGAHAIADGYFRDAVSSFTVSLERFHEFYVEVVSLKNGVSQDLFSEAWKQVSKQSERQLGAFAMLYVNEEHREPPILDNSNRELRNRVVHQGWIPSRAQAIGFGQAVQELIIPTLAGVKRRHPDLVRELVRRHIGRTHKGADKSPQMVQFLTIPTIISLSRADSEPQPKLVEVVHLLELNRPPQPV